MSHPIKPTGLSEATSDNVSVLRLSVAWEQCEKHLYHLEQSIKALQPNLPITEAYISSQTDEQVRVWDQFILRFTKLQDTLGARFYPALLDYLQEPAATQAMIDKLQRLEQLGFLEQASDWGVLRAIRNQFAHDYPFDENLKAAYLHQAIESVAILRQAMALGQAFMAAKGFLQQSSKNS